MAWTWIDVALAVLALLGLALAALRLWRRVRTLNRAVKEASTQIGAVTTVLEAVQHRDA